ncbi:hypothetical protein PQS90_09075 [Pseudomonas sp. BLCC-B13]|uniref:hypothetical protein n=1 Tax=Pseudomonas sp. BLCC-B13 TaxID=3025314 RepID=UPI00234F985A|nr:hypothetical protein [Pseudomonas sp. BLCC-B13]MDC7825301.1 hypothetical protein [Pseudomonas sp. BLCC-B13]
MNPYRITGPAQIGLSGGRTSGYLTHRILEAHGGTLPADVHVFFQNTGKEVEQTLRFVQEMSERWAFPVVWMEWCREYGQPEDAPWYRLVDFHTASRHGEPFDMMLDYYARYRLEEKQLPPVLPNFSNNMCTAYLKIKIGEKHMRSMGYEHLDCVVGIRYDEPGRYHRMMAANERGGTRWENYTPLYLDGVTKEQVAELWSQQPFDLGIHSDMGNCDLCWKKSEDKLYRSIIEDPSRVLWWSGTEERFGQVFRQDRPKYAHMAWYAERIATQDSFDFESTSLITEDIDCFCGD